MSDKRWAREVKSYGAWGTSEKKSVQFSGDWTDEQLVARFGGSWGGCVTEKFVVKPESKGSPAVWSATVWAHSE